MAVPAGGLPVLQGSFGKSAAHIHIHPNVRTIAGVSRVCKVSALPPSFLEEDKRGLTQQLLTGNSTYGGDQASKMSSSLSFVDRVVGTTLHNNERSASDLAMPSLHSLQPELHHVTDFCIDEKALQSPVSSLTHNLIIIILNQELPICTPALWKQGQLHICADGGANRLYDELPFFFPLEAADTVRRSLRAAVSTAAVPTLAVFTATVSCSALH
ncbi:hypothetical protein CBR_g34733 [Chara braunii]|uniref:Thiamin pyrophosphokinase catalytic domain-containing protein n=1 Tax=Chara braunii TaxID=69332 RepID=A0A388JZA2_CHABU|nr:hypothetical protein CBR_g34733 [Chara braunii]|eukprot:GBG63033.1 hypothetical protein CBR_g34733 [Chara braunii]